MQKSEARLAKAEQLAHLGSWELDLIQNKLAWSDEVYRIFGLQPQEFAATYEIFLERVSPDDREAVDNAYSSSLREGKDTYEIEHRILRLPTEEVRWVHERCEHIRDENGKIVRSIGMILDITERKKAEAQQDLMTGILRILNREETTIAASIRDVMRFIRNATGFAAVGLRLRRGDDAPYYEQNGFSEEFIIKENFLCQTMEDGTVKRDDQGKALLECTCGLILDGRTDPTLPFFTSNGSFWTNKASELLLIPLEADPRTKPRNYCIHQGYESVALIPVRSGKEIIGLLQLNDLHQGRLTLDAVQFLEGLGDQLGLALKRLQVQEELRILNASLEERVSARTAEAEQRSTQLRLLAAELTMAEDRERQRLTQVLHDGLQQILAGARYQLSTMEGSKGSATEVASMIDDAIEMSRSLTAELSPPILHQSGFLAGLQWLAPWMQTQHGITVHLLIHQEPANISEEISVFLFHAVRELLFNVTKHAKVNAASIEVSRREGQLHVTVIDKGTGFDHTQLRTQGGTTGGFGLFRINERITLFGGNMSIESMPGTRITLTVPEIEPALTTSATARQTPQIDTSIAPHAPENIRILLVDDHTVVRRGLASMLQEQPDLEIVGEAADGATAVVLARQWNPDIVLMDISMPVMDGIQATRIIHAELPKIAIIGLSMFQQKEQAEAMRNAGAVYYLAKSDPTEDVLAAIRKYAKQS